MYRNLICARWRILSYFNQQSVSLMEWLQLTKCHVAVVALISGSVFEYLRLCLYLFDVLKEFSTIIQIEILK